MRSLGCSPGLRQLRCSRTAKDDALHAIADALVAATDEIVTANAEDLDRGRDGGLSEGLLDRLTLDDRRIAAIAQAVRDIAALPDPVVQRLSAVRRWPTGPRDPADACPDGSDRDDLRGPPQRHGGRRHAGPQERQRGDSPRRIGRGVEQPGTGPRHARSPCGARDRRERRMPARRGRPRRRPRS